MRTSLFIRLVVPIAMVAAAFDARGDDDAKAIVRRALKANGAPEGGNRCTTWTETGTLQAAGLEFRYVADWSFQSPDRYRFGLTGQAGDGKISLTVVFDGKTAWEAGMGMVREVTGPKLDYMRNEAYSFHVIGLAPLLSDPRFRTRALGERSVNGSPATVVQVDRRERPSIKLFFDKKSGLCVKSEMLNKDEFQGWKEVLDEAYFDDYRKVDGRMLFHKLRVVRDGKPLLDAVLSNQRFPNGLEAKLFGKPAS